MFKKICFIIFSGVIALNVACYANDDYSEDIVNETFQEYEEDEPITTVSDVNQNSVVDINQDDELADQVAAQALNDYQVEGSLFEKITVLEQEKVVVQLEKERAQLDLELDRLNAERIKLQMELDTLSGRADQQQRELETAKIQLEQQAEELKRQRDIVEDEYEDVVSVKIQPKSEKTEENKVSKKYKLINVVGVGNQLQATLEEIASGQNKRIAVGKELDGYTVKSISLNDGIIFEKDGTRESLNIGK